MLLQFIVQNYASIRDEVILSLEPSSDQEHPENILSKGKYKAGGITAIYGANASGKTAVYKALTMALVILRASNIRQINDPAGLNLHSLQVMEENISMGILQTGTKCMKNIFIGLIHPGRH